MIVLNFICALLGIAWTLFVSGLAFCVLIFNQGAAHFFCRLFAGGWCKLYGVRLKVEGLENLPREGACVLAPNHTSIFDVFAVMLLPYDFKWVLKASLMRIPIFGWAVWAMGNYWVKRNRTGRDVGVMKKVEAGLQKGVSVVMFPEGTRSDTGELLPFRKGAFRVAQNSGVPLIPAGIVGAEVIAPKGKLPRLYGYDVTVRLGKPFHVGPDDDIPLAMEQFRDMLQGLIAQGK